MNSKSFLFATIFIVLSFFAICFVWEVRSALPEGGGKEIAVGACATGFKSATLKDSVLQLFAAIKLNTMYR